MRYKPFSPLPDFVEIDGERYSVCTDFRVWIEISVMLSEKSVPLKARLCFLLMNGYSSKLPKSMERAVEALLGFMNMNEGGMRQRSDSGEAFSFISDERLIYAAFRQQYGINLYKEELHWWEFVSLLSALDENTLFMKIVGYRSIDCSKIKDESRRRFYRKMKNRYRLNENVGDSDIAGALML